MPDFTFPVATGGSLEDIFTDTPDSIRTFFRRGFAVLSKLSPERYGELIAVAAENLPASHLAPNVPAEIASAMGVTKPEAMALLGVATLLTSTFTQRQELPEDLIGVLQKAGILESAHIPATRAFSELVLRDRDSLTMTLERARIGVEILPSFQQLSTTTDVRLALKKGRISLAVPIIVAGLATDANKRLWFQLTKKQLEGLIAQLQDAKRDLESAEQWIATTVGEPAQHV